MSVIFCFLPTSPGENRRMGIFDGLFGYSQKEIDKTYREGVEEAKKEGAGFLDDLADFLVEPFMDDAAKARERGRKDYRTGKTD